MINMLPLAEKIPESSACNYKVVKQGFKLDLPFWVYILYFAGMIFAYSRSITAGLSMFGGIFIIMPFDAKTTLKVNGHSVANTMWNRVTSIIFGSTILIFNISCLFSEKTETETGTEYTATKTSMMILKVYIAALIALMIGRLIYLIVIAFAILARKKACTVPVNIEYEKIAVPSGSRVFRYYYEGNSYHFIDHDDQVTLIYTPSQRKYSLIIDQVYVDPNCPESYYSRQIFGHNYKLIKSYFKKIFFLLLCTSILWLPYVIKVYIDHLYN